VVEDSPIEHDLIAPTLRWGRKVQSTGKEKVRWTAPNGVEPAKRGEDFCDDKKKKKKTHQVK